MFVSPIGLAVFGILASGWWWWWWSCRERRKKEEKKINIQGSTGWPFIGESLEFIACGRASNPLSFMHKRRARYGKVFKSHLFGRPIIISTDIEVNKLVLQNDRNAFIPFYPESITKLMGEYSILQTIGDQHKRLHGLIGGFLKSPSLKEKITKYIETSVGDFFSRWKENKQIYIQDETKQITFQVLVMALLGIGPGEEMEFFKGEFQEFIKGLICLPINLPGTRLYKSLKAKEKILKLIEKIVKDKLMSDQQEPAMDVADVLLNEMKSAIGQQRLSVESISSNILEMMIPGEETVPTLMTLAVKFLSDNPSTLETLVEENMKLKREKGILQQDYTWGDYMSLSFTHSVINETLRLGNIINAVWRKTAKDVNIKGYKIPKGWCIMTSFTTIHLDEENYEKPLEFDPWRWQRKEKITQNTFTPFGGGQRLCPGLEFSRLEVAIFIHHLVTNFSWVAEEDIIVTFPTVKMRRRLPITLSPL